MLDENDKLRAGVLGYDPFEGAVPLTVDDLTTDAVADENAAGIKPWKFEPIFRQVRIARPTDVIRGLLVAGARAVVGGEPKRTRKTWLLLQLAICIAAGRPFLGFAIAASSKVLFYSGEEPRWRVQERVRALGAGLGISDPDTPLLVAGDDVPRIRLNDLAHLATLRATIAEYTPNVIVLEPWRRLHDLDENSSSEIGPLLDSISDMAKATGAAIVLSHHTSKSGATTGGASLRGSGDLRSWYDLGLHATRKGDLVHFEVESRDEDVQPFAVALRSQKNEHGEPMIWLERVDGAAASPGGDDIAETKARIIAELVRVAGPLTRNRIAENIRGNRTKILDAVRELIAEGRIHEIGKLGVEVKSGANS